MKGNVVSERTTSETYFEKLCANRRVVCERISETKAKSPDYRVLIPPMVLITEVKQLDPNDEDERLSKIWGTPQSPGVFSVTKRVHDKLADGYPQVERLSEGKFPTMIVVYNNAAEWNLLSGFTITTAMFGSYGFVLESQSDETIEVARQGHFGNRKVTEKTCRSLSAVGVLKRTESETLELCCYHNPFAKVPIEPDLLAKLASDQYGYSNPHQGRYVSWEPKRIEIQQASSSADVAGDRFIMNALGQYLNRIRHRVGWLGIIVLMLPILYWVWLMASKPVISVFNGTVPGYVISGKLFSEPFNRIHAGIALDQPTIGKWLFWFTFMTVSSLPYATAVRWLSNRRNKSGYLAYGICVAILCTFLLCMLSWPLTWLIQYVNSMGPTPNRICGLLYSISGAALVVGFLVWALRRPKEPPFAQQTAAIQTGPRLENVAVRDN